MIWQSIVRLYHEARTKVTTYVALVIAILSQLPEHAEDLRSAWPDLMSYLPSTTFLQHISHYTLSALGLLVIWTRVRRALSPK